MYFILEIIIFIARLFPDRQLETIRQEQSEQKKKPDHATTSLLRTAKSTPKPRRDQPTAKVTVGSHESSEGAQVSIHSDASLEKRVVDTLALTNAHISSHRSAQRSIRLQLSTRPLRLRLQPRHSGATLELHQNPTLTRSTHHQPDHGRNGAVGPLSRTNVGQAIIDMVVQAGGASVSKTNSRQTLTLQNAEAHTQETTSYTYIYTNPSGNSSSESTLVNTPTEALSPLKLQRECVEEASESDEQRLSEEAEALGPNNRGNDGPFEAVGKVSGEQVAAEQTGPMVQECLLRSEEAAHQRTRNELARLQAWCEAEQDENASFQTQLLNAEREIRRIRKELDASRIEELGEVEDGEGRERGQNETGAPTSNTDMTGDNTFINEVDAIQAEGYGTTSDNDDDHDDDISRHGRPMRSGTASRLSTSFFTTQSEKRPGQPSSSHLEGPQEVQEACGPALPTPSSNHLYPEAPVDLEEELEPSNGIKFTFGSNYTVLPNVPAAEEAGCPRATSEVEGIEESVPQPEAGQRIFSFSFDFAGETSRVEAPRRKNNRNDGRGNQNSSRNQSRLPRASELAYNPAIFDFSWQSQPEESVRSSLSGVTENGYSGPLDAGNEPGSRTLGASDVNVDATAAVIDPSLEARYNLLIQSTNTEAELREARDGKTRMTDSEPEDAPLESIPRAIRATWAPFPWVETPVEVKKSPAELMNELPFDWMLPTPPTIRLSDVEGRIGQSSRSRYSSAVQEGMHIANMKAWIESIAPLEKGLNAVKTLKMQPSRATSKAHDSQNAEGRALDAMPLPEDQTEEAESTADGQTQEIKPSSAIQTAQAPQTDLPSFEEELLGLINGIEKLSLGPSMETAGTAFEEELLSLTDGIRDLSLGPSIDAAGKMEKEVKAQVTRNSNESDQGHTEDLENLIHGIRDLSLGPSVDAAGRNPNGSRVQLSGDWNVSGLGQYSPKDLNKDPIFGRFLGIKSEVTDLGFIAKKECISAPAKEITNEIDRKCKKAQSVINPHTTFPPQQSLTQEVTTDQSAATSSPTETSPHNAVHHQQLEPTRAIPRDHQPPSQTEEVYVSVYSMQGLSDLIAAPREKYISPFSIRRDRK
ncbi:hypothetical protein BDR22DRAFT_974177 [Usnea florida]